MRKSFLIALGVTVLLAGAASAYIVGEREPVVFYAGPTRMNDEIQGAPSHSGGLDRNGCHNGSVPYHCH